MKDYIMLLPFVWLLFVFGWWVPKQFEDSARNKGVYPRPPNNGHNKKESEQ